MKKYAGGYIAMLLLAGIGFGPALHAADEPTVEQALVNWSQNIQQSIASSGTDALQLIVQDALKQMIQDAMQLEQPKLRRHILLSDDMPLEFSDRFHGDAAGKVPAEHKLPQTNKTWKPS